MLRGPGEQLPTLPQQYYAMPTAAIYVHGSWHRGEGRVHTVQCSVQLPPKQKKTYATRFGLFIVNRFFFLSVYLGETVHSCENPRQAQGSRRGIS